MEFNNEDYLDIESSMEMSDIGYVNDCSRVLIYKAHKWFRMRGINIDVRYNYISKYYFVTVCDDKDWFESVRNDNSGAYTTYESALTDGIKCAIRFYKKMNNI